MKLKILRKKVRRLEARLREGPKKLAKLKRKLAALTAAKARKTQKKAAARAVARQTVKPSTAPKTKNVRPAVETKSGAATKKVKRKLNISPERRAELSAAMKARWAAKRASEANPTGTGTSQDPALTPGL
jgi:alkylhydroperoxidase family enzyme